MNKEELNTISEIFDMLNVILNGLNPLEVQALEKSINKKLITEQTLIYSYGNGYKCRIFYSKWNGNHPYIIHISHDSGKTIPGSILGSKLFISGSSLKQMFLNAVFPLKRMLLKKNIN